MKQTDNDCKSGPRRPTALVIRLARPGLMLLLVTFSLLIAPTAWAGNNGSGALVFDGVNEHVNLGAPATFNLGISDFTIEAWFKTEGTGWYYLVGKGGTGLAGQQGYGIALNNGQVYGYLQDDAGRVIFPTVGSGYNDGNWHHIAAVFDRDANFTPYVDGIALTPTDISATIQSVNGTANLFIGRYGGPGGFWSGAIEEVRLWNVARTPAEIQASMFGELYGSESGLIGYWPLNERFGSTTADITANGNDGTLINMEALGDWITSTAPLANSIAMAQADVTGFWASRPVAASGGLQLADNSANPFLRNLGDDIVLGHNNQVGHTAVGLPAGVERRWSRVWYCDLNDLLLVGGGVDLVFDFNDAGMSSGAAPSGPAGNYKLLEGPAENGPFTIIAAATAVDSTQRTVTFSNVDSAQLCSYITLGTTDAQTSPTAIILQGSGARAARQPAGLLFGLAALVLLGLTLNKRTLVRAE